MSKTYFSVNIQPREIGALLPASAAPQGRRYIFRVSELPTTKYFKLCIGCVLHVHEVSRQYGGLDFIKRADMVCTLLPCKICGVSTPG